MTIIELPPASRVPVVMVAAVATPTAVLASGIEGAFPPLWLTAIAVLLGAMQATLPESGFGTAGGLLALGWWGLGEPASLSGLPPAVLLAAAALLAGHVACILASAAPQDVPIDPGLTRLWIARGAFLMLPALAAWAVAGVVRSVEQPPGVWALGVVVVLAALTAAQIAMPRMQDERDG